MKQSNHIHHHHFMNL